MGGLCYGGEPTTEDRNSHPNFVDRGLPGHREAVSQIPDLIERGKLRVERFHKKFNDQLV